MTYYYFEKILLICYRFLGSSVGRAEGFKAEGLWFKSYSSLLFFSYFSKSFMTKKNSSRLIFLLKNFSIMVIEAQKPIIIGTCA